jgi:DNA-directed RNA polymerase I subunit RPA2
MTFDPLSPSLASSSKDHTTFHTLSRERAFRHPSIDGPDIAALEELVKPHIDSFNALTEEHGMYITWASKFDADRIDGPGLLQLGVNDIGQKVVFDGRATEGRPLGNKITCEYGLLGEICRD